MKYFAALGLLCLTLSACTTKPAQEEPRAMLASGAAAQSKVQPPVQIDQEKSVAPAVPRTVYQETPFFSLRGESLSPRKTAVQQAALQQEEQPIEEEKTTENALPDEELADRLSQLFFDKPTPTESPIQVTAAPAAPATPESMPALRAEPEPAPPYRRWVTLVAFLLGAVVVGAPIGCYLHIRYLREHRDV